MKLYLSHASNFDYQTELYDPLKKALADGYDLYFPHDPENAGQYSKDVIASCDAVIAEVSRPSTGQGIELGWAEAASVPIICFYRQGATPSGALQHIAQTIFAYGSIEDVAAQLPKLLS